MAELSGQEIAMRASQATTDIVVAAIRDVAKEFREIEPLYADCLEDMAKTVADKGAAAARQIGLCYVQSLEPGEFGTA